MEKSNFPKSFKVYLPLIVIFVLLVFLMPRSSRFSYDYRKGSPWEYETLISQFDFPILKTDEQYQREVENAGSRVIPYYRYDSRVSAKSEDVLSSMDFGTEEAARQAVTGALSDVVLRDLDERLTYLRGLEKRKEEVRGLITGLEKMTDEYIDKLVNSEVSDEDRENYIKDYYQRTSASSKTRILHQFSL